MNEPTQPSPEQAYRQWQDTQQVQADYMNRVRTMPTSESDVLQGMDPESAYQKWLEDNGEHDKPFTEELGEFGASVIGGARDGLQELNESIKSAGDWLNENVADLGAITWDGDGDVLESGAAVADMEPAQLPEVAHTGDTGDEFVRSTAQFLVGFLPALRATRVLGGAAAATKLGGAASGLAAGMTSDAFAFDPDSPRLSQMLQQWGQGNPVVDNAVTDYLAGDPDDSEVEKRLKNALEGAGLGLLAEGAFRGIKAFAKARRAKGREAEALQAETTPRPTPERVNDSPGQGVDQELPRMKPVFRPEVANVDELSARLKDGNLTDLDEAMGFNLENIEDAGSIRETIQTTSEVFQEQYTKVTGGQRSHAAVKRLADEKLKLARELGVEVDFLNDLYAGTKNLDGKFLAVRSLMASSSKKVFELAKQAETSGTVEDLVALRRAVAIHSGIQAEAKGIQTEIARALNAMKIEAQSKDAQAEALGQLVEGTGGVEVNLKFAQRINDLATAENPRAALAAFTRRSAYQKTRDAVLESYINGLLSNPSTQILNISSNFFTMFTGVGERAVAGMGRRQAGGVARGEAFAMLHGMQQSFSDALRLSGQAFKRGEPQDHLSKLDFEQPGKPHAISAEGLDAKGGLGRAVDWVGNVVRLPGRLLMTSDEFFKVMNGRAEQYALAWRKAAEEAADKQDFRRLYQHYVSNASTETLKEARKFAQHQTFTRALEGSSAKLQSVLNSAPELRLFMPFVRTPLNLLKYTGERTPVIRKRIGWIKEDLESGDVARAQLAKAKLRTGQMLYVTGMGLALNGTITGKAPSDPELRRRLMETGWRPYSVKVDNEYVPYNRADPWGMFLGISADLVTIGQYLGEDDAEYSEAGLMAMASVHDLVTEKAYFQGLSNLSDLVSGEPWEQKRVTQDVVTSLLPYSSLSRGITRSMDPVIRETNSTIDQLYRKLPGYSKELPPKRNLIGEPSLYREGWAMNLLSPVRPSERKGKAVLEEIARLQIDVQGTESLKQMGGQELTLDQRDFIAKRWGQLNKQNIGPYIASEQYAAMTDGERAVVIEKMLRKFKDAASREATGRFPELLDAYVKEKQEEAAELNEQDRTPFFNF